MSLWGEWGRGTAHWGSSRPHVLWTHNFILPRLVARCPGLADVIGEIWKRKSRVSPQNTQGGCALPGVTSGSPQPTLPRTPWLTHSLGAQALVLELLVRSVGVDDEVLHAGAGELLLHTTLGVRDEAAARVCWQSCHLPAAPAAVWGRGWGEDGQKRGRGGKGGPVLPRTGAQPPGTDTQGPNPAQGLPGQPELSRTRHLPRARHRDIGPRPPHQAGKPRRGPGSGARGARIH